MERVKFWQKLYWRRPEQQLIEAPLALARAANITNLATPHSALTGYAFPPDNCRNIVSCAGRPVMFLQDNLTYLYPKKPKSFERIPPRQSALWPMLFPPSR